MIPNDSRGYIGGPSCVEPHTGFHNRHQTMEIGVNSDNFGGLVSKGAAELKKVNADLDKKLADLEREMRELGLEPTELPSQQTLSSGTNTTTNSGCFIATAAFGSPYHERINVLRCWRDVRLRQSRLTAPFVRWYYAISPPIARWVAKSKTLKFIIRAILKPMIWLISIQVKNEFQMWEDDRSLPRAVDYNYTNLNNQGAS